MLSAFTLPSLLLFIRRRSEQWDDLWDIDASYLSILVTAFCKNRLTACPGERRHGRRSSVK
jgi:hypothetical protein